MPGYSAQYIIIVSQINTHQPEARA